MSSILKALEKAEESKGPNRMAGESGLIRSRRSRPTWVMPVAVLGGAAVAALVTFAAMGGFSGHAPVAQAPVAVAKSAPVVVAPLNPVIETPAAPPEQAVPAESAEPAGVAGWNSGTAANPIAVPAAKALPAANKKTAVPTAVPLPVGRSRVVPAAPRRASVQPAPAQAATVQTAPVPAPAPAVAPAPATPELKVSGIAWQGKGESSFAVVNGRAVLQGGVVDGYKVLEIHQDMVRFSGSNGNIDVPLGGDDK